MEIKENEWQLKWDGLIYPSSVVSYPRFIRLFLLPSYGRSVFTEDFDQSYKFMNRTIWNVFPIVSLWFSSLNYHIFVMQIWSAYEVYMLFCLGWKLKWIPFFLLITLNPLTSNDWNPSRNLQSASEIFHSIIYI